MAMTDTELHQALGNEEPDYVAIAGRLTQADLPRIAALAQGGDLAIASKAVYLASLLGGGEAVMMEAAASRHPVLRAASASGLPNLAAAGRERVVDRLLDDGSPAVAKLALRAIDRPSPALLTRLRSIESSGAAPELRALVRQKLGN